MHAILFCDQSVTCIPVQDMPEALLPCCNIPLLAHILRYLENNGFTEITLVHADERTIALADSFPLQPQLNFASDTEDLCTSAPTLVLRRLCPPLWDMGELHSLCEAAPVRLLHPDGSPTAAELHPAGSSLTTPETAVTAILSVFRSPRTPAEYLQLQKELLRNKRMADFRLGQGILIGKQAAISESSVIGNECVIGDRAVVEDCVLGDGVQVGAGAVLRRCVLCSHALADRDVKLEDAAVAPGEIAAANRETPVKRHFFVDAQDGIHEGLPRWNTADTALQAGAALTVLGSRIAVGFENPAGEHLTFAAVSGAVSQGAEVWNAGCCALSQLIFSAKAADCHALLWVHGNAVQMLSPHDADGFALTDARIGRLRRALESGLSTRIVTCGKCIDARPFLQLWENACRRIFHNREYTVEICCGNPALRETAHALFSGGTGERIVLNLSEDGTRVSAFSQESGMVHHEQLLLLSLLSFREKGEALALPADFHPAAEDFAARFGGRILRLFTPSVSPTAAALYHAQGVCTDGILLFCHVLRILAMRHMTLAQAVSLLPPMYTAKREISTSLSRQSVEKLRRQNPDRAVHLELSPHGKLLQLLVHAETMEAASELCGFWEKKLRSAESGRIDLSGCAE